MPEPSGSEARLQSLKRRWETEKSTAFLPLAEEYRRLGRLREAIDVLETGLRANPGYTSGMVALGRCRLESGNAASAAEVLEKVVAQDPEQMVASKLLIDAYLRTGRAREARSRLKVYSALNAKDPEIARLADRIQALSPVDATPPAPAPPAEPAPVMESGFEPEPEPARAWTGAPVLAAPPSVGAGNVLFQGLDGPVVLSRYVRGLASEGLFRLVFPAAVRATVAAPAAIPEPVVAAADAGSESTAAEIWSAAEVVEIEAESEPVPAEELLAAPVEVEAELEPFEADVERAISRVVPVPAAPVAAPVEDEQVAEPEAPAVTAAEPAEQERLLIEPQPASTMAETATLGGLYLQQGHAADAERIFGAVLGRDPDNDDARRGFDQAQRLRQAPGGLSVRRAQALRDYLRRLTGREERHVP
jgi:tetratricopeptide (TPR) repeat protein